MTEKEINTKTAIACCIKWMEKYNKICPNKEKQLAILESIKELKFMSFDMIQKSINNLKKWILSELEGSLRTLVTSVMSWWRQYICHKNITKICDKHLLSKYTYVILYLEVR